jgi:hypothetical protein
MSSCGETSGVGSLLRELDITAGSQIRLFFKPKSFRQVLSHRHQYESSAHFGFLGEEFLSNP